MSTTRWNPVLYDEQHHFVAEYGKALLPLLHAEKGERILDLGCGTGTLTYEIAKTGAFVIGIDKSPEMIQQARKKYPEIDFKIVDAEDFYFDMTFAAVFSNAALHWILQPEKTIECISKVLENNGRFVFEMGAKGNINRVLNAIKQAAHGFGITDYPMINYYPSLAEYAALLEKYGFRIDYAVTFDRPTMLQGEEGLRNWLREFRGKLLENIPVDQHESFFTKLEEIARPVLYHDNAWWADYVRLRMVAIK